MNVNLVSFIIPVYNRPEEIEELLESLVLLRGDHRFEVVVVEDGSNERCEDICSRFRESVTIQYHYKNNSGPGDSRNYGMRVANGDYFVILDSDCIVPPGYLEIIFTELGRDFVHCYGGPDAAEEDFSNVQKAINYTMTSFLTTGGIRGGSEKLGKFQPRSFNMGLSKEAFEKSGGFGKIHPGEDPDLTIRLWNLGYQTRLFPDAYVYHKRRISYSLFYKQVKKFGMVRVILNKWHPDTRKITYWFPVVFTIGFILSFLMLLFGISIPIICYALYLFTLFIDSSIKNGVTVGFYSIGAAIIQFYGYACGFIESYFSIVVKKEDERVAFPTLFFK
ncbi:glycosyl transferase family 2 [Nonlabens spongiae]|uniref:Glycosyl transferase family 2 n=1 Tax=Nonlabens spongiae TaxID=331648 RepID=A0A1W6MJN4_9FLAO|nr:glycosyltransferase [Nonlabens spongiae]ARN77824.1 glycosyl transferase family 2 [Nonlabens spongiae]